MQISGIHQGPAKSGEKKKGRDEKPLNGFEHTYMIVDHLESVCEYTKPRGTAVSRGAEDE